MQDIKNKIYELVKLLDSDKFNMDIAVLSDTLYYRLTILRLGEEDNNAWWESTILSEIGRRNLDKFFPNTFNRQRYNIAAKIINEKEKREISENIFTTLFNFGYEFETEVFKPFIEEISKLEEWEDLLKMIEAIKGNKFNDSWARNFYHIEKLPENKIISENTIEIGKISKNFYNNTSSFEEAIKSFLSIYDMSTVGNVKTAYYIRRMAI